MSEEKRATALKAVLQKLLSTEAAMQDVLSAEFSRVSEARLDTDDLYKRRYELRIHTAALNLWHLADAVRRLAKRSGVDPAELKQFCESQQSIRVLKNLCNSGKHGLGGIEKQSCFLNGFCIVRRREHGKTEPDDVVHVLGMLITDGKEGVFSSTDLLRTAIRKWGAWLEPRFGISQGWVAKCAPRSDAPVVMLKPDEHVTVEQGTLLLGALPDDLSERLRAEALWRGESA